MFRKVPRVRRTPELWARRVTRRGSALILVLLMTVTLAAIAMSAILLTGSGGMITRYYDRERDFRYAAEASLQMGKARLLRDTTIHLPDSGYVTLISGGTITGADGLVIPNVKVNMYAGLSGNTTGQFGEFASIVAEAYDAGGTRYVRRLEMQAENFARYAMFTNTWPGGCYTTGEFIAGRAHSNQLWNSCGSPTYYDTVSAVTTVGGGTPVYKKGKINGAPYIPIPPVSRLAALHSHATDGNLDVAAVGNDLSTVRTRIEFVAIDLDNDSLITGDREGFIRVYQAVGPAASTARLQSDPQSVSGGNAPQDDMCGDFHVDSTGRPRFYSIAAHNTQWFRNNFLPGPPPADKGAVGAGISPTERDTVMQGTQFRCYMSGDPHLVATERRLMYPALDPGSDDDSALWAKGGEDTTFTDSTQYGFWQKWAGDKSPVVTALTAETKAPWVAWRGHEATLWPLFKTLNPGTHGTIHVHGPVLLSGILRGRVTVYAQSFGGQTGVIGYPDDLVYAQDPASVTCANLLGVISDGNQLILDNAINSPQRARGGSGWAYRWADGNDNGMATSHDFVLHGVTMSRLGTVGVENYSQHPENLQNCNAANSGRGCIRQAGGVIEQTITATFSGSGDGYGENRSVDVCLNKMSPPYFPTTGRYLDNRFYEIDPARYNIMTLFQSLQGGF